MNPVTWTVDVSYLTINNTTYFRSESEADNFILQTKYTLRQMNITEYTIIKNSHTWES